MCTNQKEPEKEESKVIISDINSNVISEFDASQQSVQADDIDTHEIDKNLGNEASLCTFSDSNEEVQPKDYLYHDCQLCSRRLKFREGWGKTRLWDHVRRHLGVKAAKCGWCSYAEVTSDYVRRHSLKEHPKMKVVYIDTR
uniref:C2H2-type domain-containing protein n=1 Tax=Heterorhabditis bacteriophora TaxID=37862 RepID=A0A1I7WKI4_HETBA